MKLYRGRSEKYEKDLAAVADKLETVSKKEKELDEQRAKMFVEDAVRRQIVDKSEFDFWVDQYAKDPDSVRKLFESRNYSILTKRISLAGDAAPPTDAIMEAKGRVAEMIANDTTKKLTEAEAYNRLWKENPDLFARHVEARRATAEKKGGER